MDLRWASNQYIKGTYSYRTISTDPNNISPKDLAEPLLVSKVVNGCKIECPRIMFAGEATDTSRYGTMDGAMKAGKREAERLSNYLRSMSK